MNLQKAIREIKTNTASLNIYLDSNQIKDEGAKAIAGGIKDTKLHSLNIYLWNNQIKDEGAKAIAGGIKDTKLHSLNINLRNNQIKDEGARAIADGIKDTKLHSLNIYLKSNQIKDEGAKAIAGGIKDTKLHSLNIDLRRNQIKDEGAKILSDAIKKSSAKIELYYYNNDINEEGKTALKNALALNEDFKHREQQKARQEAEAKQKARQESEQQKIVEQINNINIDTNKTKLESIKILSINSNLKDKFYKKFNEIQNQLQTKINNINTTYAKSNIAILDKQAEHYGLGKNAATAKFNEIKDDKYLKFIELQDNTAIKTIFKSEECFKVFELQNIQMCLKGTDIQVVSQAKIGQNGQEYDSMYKKHWIIKKGHYITDLNSFLKICLDEFAAKQVVSCNHYDSKKAISHNIQNLDIQMQSIAIFSSEKCFSVFKLENLEMCYRRTKTQILPKSSVDRCYDPDLCMYSPSWSISIDENLSLFEDYFRVCREEFEYKHFTPCTQQQQPEEQDYWSLIEKSVAGIMVVGIVTLIGAILVDFAVNTHAPLLIGGETEGV